MRYTHRNECGNSSVFQVKQTLESALTLGKDYMQVVRQIFEGMSMYLIAELRTCTLCYNLSVDTTVRIGEWTILQVQKPDSPDPPADCQSEGAEPCHKVIFVYCIDLLNTDQLQSQVAKELVGKLLIEVMHTVLQAKYMDLWIDVLA